MFIPRWLQTYFNYSYYAYLFWSRIAYNKILRNYIPNRTGRNCNTDNYWIYVYWFVPRLFTAKRILNFRLTLKVILPIYRLKPVATFVTTGHFTERNCRSGYPAQSAFAAEQRRGKAYRGAQAPITAPAHSLIHHSQNASAARNQNAG